MRGLLVSSKNRAQSSKSPLHASNLLPRWNRKIYILCTECALQLPALAPDIQTAFSASFVVMFSAEGLAPLLLIAIPILGPARKR
jgi:hypothetical protein